MSLCFITQQIHPDAVTCLNEAGITTRYATEPSMEAVIREIGDADAVITRDLGLSEEALRAAPKLKIISCHGSGTNRIAKAAAAERGVLVTNAPNTNSRSVAEMTIGLLLAVMRRLCEADRAVREGNWAFRYTNNGTELYGRTIGLVGFGAIARHVAQIAGQGLGMRVVAWSPSVPAEVFEAAGVERAQSLEDLLGVSDVLSLHRPAQGSGQPTIDAQALSRLKKGAVLINTSRGGEVDGPALVKALETGHVGGAGLDVMSPEPPLSDDPLLQAPNVVLTPHIGATTEQALRRMAMLCASQVQDALAGCVPPHCL
ncbi:MAG: hydroxyacid dehydrogenase [Gluconobacter albidus]